MSNICYSLFLATLILSGKIRPDLAYSHLCHPLAGWRRKGSSPGCAVLTMRGNSRQYKNSCWSTWQRRLATCRLASCRPRCKPPSRRKPPFLFAACSGDYVLYSTDWPQLRGEDSLVNFFLLIAETVLNMEISAQEIKTSRLRHIHTM